MKKFFGLILAIVAMCTMSSCVERIDAGYEGVKVSLSGDDKGSGSSLVTGWVWYSPWSSRIYEYPLFVQTVDYEPFDINSKDGTKFIIDPSMSVRIQPGQSPFLITKYKKEDLSEVINTALLLHVKEAARNVFNRFSADSIVSNRSLVDKAFDEYVRNSFAKEGFVLEQLTPGIKYPKSYEDAINAKNVAIQNEMRIANEVKVAEANAKKAEAEAQVTIAKAKAEAEANRLKTQAITPLLLQQQWIEKWSGEVPQVMGSNGSIFYDLNGKK